MPNDVAVIRSGVWSIFAATITIATAALAAFSFSDALPSARTASPGAMLQYMSIPI
jgi:hypothetical protein